VFVYKPFDERMDNMKNTNETKRRIPVIAVVAAVCIMGLLVASGSAFANMLPDNNAKTDANQHSEEISTSNQYIGEDAVKEIVLAEVPGATFQEICLENDDGRVDYDVEVTLNNMEYEFTIDALTGKILEQESDAIDDLEAVDDDCDDIDEVDSVDDDCDDINDAGDDD
jgi:uncharacterized membrane protein YkoI